MGALDTLLGFTRMIGGGLSAARTARVVRWGDGFTVVFDSNEEATVTFAAAEGGARWRTERLLDFANQLPNWPLTSNPKVFTADAQYFLTTSRRRSSSLATPICSARRTNGQL
jgi:hypothetical protein